MYTPEDLQSEIVRSKESVTLKIGPREAIDTLTTHAAQVMNGTSGSKPKKLTVSFLFAVLFLF